MSRENALVGIAAMHVRWTLFFDCARTYARSRVIWKCDFSKPSPKVTSRFF